MFFSLLITLSNLSIKILDDLLTSFTVMLNSRKARYASLQSLQSEL